jgi:hypothetical protein
LFLGRKDKGKSNRWSFDCAALGSGKQSREGELHTCVGSEEQHLSLNELFEKIDADELP